MVSPAVMVSEVETDDGANFAEAWNVHKIRFFSRSRRMKSVNRTGSE